MKYPLRPKEGLMSKLCSTVKQRLSRLGFGPSEHHDIVMMGFLPNPIFFYYGVRDALTSPPPPEEPTSPPDLQVVS